MSLIFLNREDVENADMIFKILILKLLKFNPGAAICSRSLTIELYQALPRLQRKFVEASPKNPRAFLQIQEGFKNFEFSKIMKNFETKCTDGSTSFDKDFIRARNISVFSHGNKPRKMRRILLNKKVLYSVS